MPTVILAHTCFQFAAHCRSLFRDAVRDVVNGLLNAQMTPKEKNENPASSAQVSILAHRAEAFAIFVPQTLEWGAPSLCISGTDLRGTPSSPPRQPPPACTKVEMGKCSHCLACWFRASRTTLTAHAEVGRAVAAPVFFSNILSTHAPRPARLSVGTPSRSWRQTRASSTASSRPRRPHSPKLTLKRWQARHQYAFVLGAVCTQPNRPQSTDSLSEPDLPRGPQASTCSTGNRAST